MPLGLGIALRRVVLAGFALGQVGVRIVRLAAAGHRRVEAAQLAALAGERDAGVNGHALDGVPGPGIAQIRVRGQIAAVQGERLAQACGPPVLVPVEAADRDGAAVAGDPFDQQDIPVQQRARARAARGYGRVLAGNDPVAGVGALALLQGHRPAGVDLAPLAQLLLDAAAQVAAFGVLLRGQDDVLAGQQLGQVVLRGGLGHLLVRAAAEPAVVVVDPQRPIGAVAAGAQRHARVRLPFGLQLARVDQALGLGQLGVGLAPGEHGERAAGLHGLLLAAVAGHDHLGALALRGRDGGRHVGLGCGRGLIQQDQGIGADRHRAAGLAAELGVMAQELGQVVPLDVLTRRRPGSPGPPRWWSGRSRGPCPPPATRRRARPGRASCPSPPGPPSGPPGPR